MRAEDAAVHVRLVDDDVAQVVQHVRPEVVPRQHADMEHVGVREDEVRPLADLPALLLRRVAVVDGGADARHRELGERAGLVLRERLRRVEVERAVLRLAGERVEDGQVEGERLPRRGAGRDHHVPARARGVPRARLVLVQLVDPLRGERGGELRVEAVRERRGPRGARRPPSSGTRAPRRRGGQPTTVPSASTRIVLAASTPVRSAPAGATTASNARCGTCREHGAGALRGASPVRGIGLDDGHLVAGEPQRHGVDAGEAELEHVGGRRADQLEHARRRARGEGGWQAEHGETVTFARRGAAARG